MMETEQRPVEPASTPLAAAEVPPPPNAVRRPGGGLVMPAGLLLGLAGAALQGYANDTGDALYVFLGFLGVGLAPAMLFSARRAELRAFLLAYSVSVFAGGVVQCYALYTFGDPQSFVDAVGFYRAIFDSPPYYTWDEIRTLWIDGIEVSRGAPLAVAIWQQLYHVRLLLGLDFGPYVGTMFNAWIMGVVAAVTVCVARDLFGNEPWRLHRVGTLSAFCGLYVLFGALLLRDCFTTLLNVLVLWGILRWVKRPSLNTSIAGAVITGLALLGMTYLRSRTLVLFGAVWALGFACWYAARRFDLSRAAITVTALAIMAAGSAYLFGYLELSRQLQEKYGNQYGEHMNEGAADSSLAVRLIVNQPLPVRLVLGTASMAIRPIPLWAGVGPGASEYHWIKGYNGLYQLVTFPLFGAGVVLLLREYRRDRAGATPRMFVLAYFLLTVLAVVATSMEQRHIAQFMPAFMLIAAIPDRRVHADRRILGQISLMWFGLVGLVHLAWLIATMNR